MLFNYIKMPADGRPMPTAEMTAEDKAKALRALGRMILTKFVTVHYENPLQQNCYITSAGCYKGIYFPNSVILLGSWEISALCKVGDDIAALVEDDQENIHFFKIA